jgi:hypothetical protein
MQKMTIFNACASKVNRDYEIVQFLNGLFCPLGGLAPLKHVGVFFSAL